MNSFSRRHARVVPILVLVLPTLVARAQPPTSPGSMVPASAVDAAPVAAPAPARFEAAAGRGVTFNHGDAYALTIRPRIQLRETVTHTPGATGPDTTNDIQVRTMRLWMMGHVIDPNLRFGVQLAFGANDFEKIGGVRQPSPIFDAFVDFRHVRDASVRVGQAFVPFDRLRTIREFALQTVDRSNPVRELTLDRDMGLTLFSDDLGGHGGRVAYHLGFYGGEGRNQFDAQEVGFLYTARLAYRPFGSFDDDAEGDLERRTSPRLAVGVAGAYNQNALRAGSTTGAFLQLGSVDYVHAAFDVVFKYRGFAFMGEALLRGSSSPTRSATVGTTLVTETPGRGVGYVVQASYMPVDRFEVWTRWDEIRLPFTTSDALRTLVAAHGRGLSGGINYYLHGHSLKFQADVAHTFGSTFEGTTQVRLQLDATF